MSNALKCPNPSCPFLFDPSLVPAGAVLTCPRCGMRFTLGPAAPALPPPPSPFEPFGNSASGESIVPPADPSVERPATTREKRRKAAQPRPAPDHSSLLPLVAIFLVVGTAVGAGVMVFSRMGTGGSSTSDLVFEQRNVSYRYPVPNWAKDDDSKSLLSANLIGLKRVDGSARIAIEARDYQTRNPQPGELREAIADRLRPLFEDLDLKDDNTGTLAGQPALKLTFRGNAASKLGSGVFLGEAYGLAYKGVGYLFFALAPEGEVNALAADLEDLRGRLTLLDRRDDWKESTTATKLLIGRDADYRLTDGDGWWKEKPEPTIEDPLADRLYDAEFKSKVRRDVKPTARLAVLLLEPAGDDPLATLRAYLRGQYEKQFDLKNWDEIKDPPLGDGPVAGEQRGIDVVRYKVSGPDPNTTKLVVLSAIKITSHKDGASRPAVVGVHAFCPMGYQIFWEKRLQQLAASLRDAG